MSVVPTTVQADRAIAPRATVDAWLAAPEVAYVGADGRDFQESSATRLSHEVNRFLTVDLSAFYIDISTDRLYTFATPVRGRMI